jgi:hypothetical protein
LRRFVDERMAESPAGFNLPQVVNEAMITFLQDPQFVDEVVRDRVQRDVYEMARRIIANTRGLILVGDDVMTPEQFQAHAAKASNRFLNWVEHAGTRYISLMQMTKGDLLLAARERETRARSELQVAVLWRHIADQLGADERVGDKFTPEDIANMNVVWDDQLLRPYVILSQAS